MSEAATVLWIPEAAMMATKPGTSIIHRGKDRQFGSPVRDGRLAGGCALCGDDSDR